jgi:hypothetical protein
MRRRMILQHQEGALWRPAVRKTSKDFRRLLAGERLGRSQGIVRVVVRMGGP